MATVTIGRPYFDALLRRAEFHTSDHDFGTAPSLSNIVTISKAEYDYLQKAVREYSLLRSALFRGGLTVDSLNTLLIGEGAARDEKDVNTKQSGPYEEALAQPYSVTVAASRPHVEVSPPTSDNTIFGEGIVQPRKLLEHHDRMCMYGQPGSTDSLAGEAHGPNVRVPVYDQRTILITNLSDRTTHKDLIGIIRGGRLLNIFLRNDRSATVSFVEGAAAFLAHAKRNDVYLHTKRLEFRWYDRQFQVPPHVAHKIAAGASRNLVVRGALGKLTTDQIRDHLDHIHNLVVVDIYFLGGDAFISTNSVHNALFAKTCMMSRTAYKGMRIDWYPDECAATLPPHIVKRPALTTTVSVRPKPTANANLYTLLDEDSGLESESDEDSDVTTGIRVSSQWADATVT